MAIDESTSLPSSMGVTHEMMACPMPRVPFLAAPEGGGSAALDVRVRVGR